VLFQVTVSDQGEPVLSSTTRVVVTVEDTNDHAPEFREKYLKAIIPALTDNSVFQVRDGKNTLFSLSSAASQSPVNTIFQFFADQVLRDARCKL